jgi:hypothetical protein
VAVLKDWTFSEMGQLLVRIVIVCLQGSGCGSGAPGTHVLIRRRCESKCVISNGPVCGRMERSWPDRLQNDPLSMTDQFSFRDQISDHGPVEVCC